MQETSDAFDAAVQTHRTWMPPRVRTDWADDGYDGDRTIDDLSPQVGDSIDIDHDLDDGYPAGARFVSGAAYATMDAELTGRTVDGVPVTASAYWSPLRSDSPVYGFDRDIAPITHDVGLVTADGPEYVRTFTGQLTNTPIKGGQARLTAVSASRIALMRPVQPPAINPASAPDTTPSWVVSWCLYACGLYAGPRIREGATVAYYPMHGGLWRFHDGGYPGGNITDSSGEQWRVFEVIPPDTGNFLDDGETGWVDGPYVSAPDLQLTATRSRRAYTTLIPLGTTAGTEADALSQAGPRARLEAWVRGDDADVNNAPGGSGNVSKLFGFRLTTTAASNPYAELGVNTARKVYVTVYDGTNTRTLTSTGTLPVDAEFHFIGAAYDLATDRLWVNLDGTVEASTTTMLQAGLPATDSWYVTDGSPFLLSYLPCGDITLTTGVQANVDDYPLWRDDDSFAPTARVTRSVVSLPGVGITAPREAWQIIADFAQAELAATRCNELDMVEYLTPAWWVRNEQQAVRDEISTRRNAAPFDVDYDPTRIRTAIKVSYTLGDIPRWTAAEGNYRRVLELRTTASGTEDVRIEQGTTDIRFVFSTPVLHLYSVIEVMTGAVAVIIGAPFPTGSYITPNAAPDGTGDEYTTGITATVAQWDAGGVTVRFVNANPIPLYLANSVNVPAMCLTGVPMTTTQTYVQVGDDSGVRGERLLGVSTAVALTEIGARRLARNILAGLQRPVPTVGDDQSGITVMADPRRQPGDLVTLTDTETGVSGGLWRLQSVRHRGKGASYTQQVVARGALPICVVGQSLVGRSLVGPATPEA